MKKIIITLAIALTVGGALSAQEYWGQTQREYKQSGGSLRGAIDDSGSGSGTPTPSANPDIASTTAPVGEGLLCLLVLGGAYALRKRSSLRA